MLRKVITYENPFTESETTEEHYFHISKADLVQMEMEEHGTRYNSNDGTELTGMQAKLQRIVDSQDGRAIMEELRDIIRRSYGKKEGDRFLKSKEIWDDFSSTEAYSQLIFDLCTSADAAAEFMNGIIPNNLEKIAAEVRAIAEQQEASSTEVAANLDGAETRLKENATLEEGDEVDKKPEPRVLTRAEMTEMGANELQAGLADGRYKLS